MTMSDVSSAGVAAFASIGWAEASVTRVARRRVRVGKCIVRMA